MKKKILAVTAMVLVLSSGMTTFAAPKEVEVNGEKFTFDAEYYAQNNPDVAAALGSSEEAVLQHYVQYGRSEGRAAYDGDTGAKTTTVAPKSTEPQPKYMEFTHSGQITQRIEYAYDANGNKVTEYDYQLISGSSNDNLELSIITNYSYNDHGDVIKETASSGSSGQVYYELAYSYEYDEQNRVSVCYVNGEKRDYSYDSQGRLSKVTSYYNGAYYNGCTYSYDKNGRKTKESNDNFGYDYSYTYDKQGRLASWKNALGTAKFYY